MNSSEMGTLSDHSYARGPAHAKDDAEALFKLFAVIRSSVVGYE
jgi:hypothetical protein